MVEFTYEQAETLLVDNLAQAEAKLVRPALNGAAQCGVAQAGIRLGRGVAQVRASSIRAGATALVRLAHRRKPPLVSTWAAVLGHAWCLNRSANHRLSSESADAPINVPSPETTHPPLQAQYVEDLTYLQAQKITTEVRAHAALVGWWEVHVWDGWSELCAGSSRWDVGCSTMRAAGGAPQLTIAASGTPPPNTPAVHPGHLRAGQHGARVQLRHQGAENREASGAGGRRGGGGRRCDVMLMPSAHKTDAARRA